MNEKHITRKHPKEHLNKLEMVLDEYLVKKAPNLPKGVKDILASAAPWFVIIGLIFMVPSIFALFKITDMMGGMPYAEMAGFGWSGSFYISAVLSIFIAVLEVMALPGLFGRRKEGWNKLFYASLISLVANLLTMNFASFLIGTLISWYILFQVRELYK